MHSFFLILAAVPSLNALCAIQGCDKWFNTVKNNEEGKLCGTVSSFNPFSSCQGPRLKDDIESVAVMPGCTLEVWDKGSGLEDAKKEENKGKNAGNIRDNKDRYDRNKLSISAFGSTNFVEEINDDFDDMDEDIESYRCKC